MAACQASGASDCRWRGAAELQSAASILRISLPIIEFFRLRARHSHSTLLAAFRIRGVHVNGLGAARAGQRDAQSRTLASVLHVLPVLPFATA
jgi:hypothetical protein